MNKREVMRWLQKRIKETLLNDPDPDKFHVTSTKGSCNYLKMECCDCGLVHNVVFLIRRKQPRLQVFWTRDNRSTGQIRRWERVRKQRQRRGQ